MQNAAQFQILCTAKVFSAALFRINVLPRDSEPFERIELSCLILVFRRHTRITVSFHDVLLFFEQHSKKAGS